jgi:putative ATP-dependent endonuclease of OLD family
LGESDQIIATTHSPWMIDLSRDLQSVTRTTLGASGFVEATNYGVSTALANLVADDKGRVRMLQLFDDELSRIFFSERVVVVEGDSEVLTIKNTLRLLPDEMRKAIMSRYQVVNARGKAAIISLVRYLRALGIDPIVMHDSDSGVEGAEKFNAPIMEAVGDPARVVMLDKCLEDALGYPPPNSDKPYRAFSSSMAWKSYDAIPAQWKEAFLRVFSDVVEA